MTVSPIVQVNGQIAIPRREIQFTFVRSSGPGGQNVNKVASKAVLRWQVATSPSIPDHLRPRLISQLGRRMNDRGELVLASQRYRDQSKNIDDCLEKLCELVAAAVKVRKRRKKTALPRSCREARLKQKRSTGERKQGRQRPEPGRLSMFASSTAGMPWHSHLLAICGLLAFGWKLFQVDFSIRRDILRLPFRRDVDSSPLLFIISAISRQLSYDS